MANQEHVDLLKQGVAQWNAWREQQKQLKEKLRPDLRKAAQREAELTGVDIDHAWRAVQKKLWPDLSGINLSKANLRGVDLSSTVLIRVCLHEADLSEANLSGADLRGTDLRGAILHEAKLRDADLSGADLRGANLWGANLFSANLSDANLSDANLPHTLLAGADLHGANLSGAFTRLTIFARVDLRETKGLANIRHDGPSRVELYSVQLPQDGSAQHFLRECGVPDEWINIYHAQMMSPIQYHSCFISYSSRDDILARRLHADLQDQGVRCWFAPEDMKIGDKIRARIDEAIHMQDKLLLLLSKHALASTWVEDEVEAALEKEQRQQREVLFPVRLDESVMQTTQAWAAKLRRTRHIGDFTTWTDPQAYQSAFDRLLRDLKRS